MALIHEIPSKGDTCHPVTHMGVDGGVDEVGQWFNPEIDPVNGGMGLGRF